MIIGVLLGLWFALFLFNSDKTESYLKNPEKGQVYIFKEDEVYAPMRLDSITSDRLFMRNYQFLFSDAIPKRSQILEEEFDLNFYAIYEKGEMERLYEEGNLVKIYP